VVATTVAAFCVAGFLLDPFHAEIEPFRLAKMNKAGPVAPMSNDVLGIFATWPVGPTPGAGPGGIATKFVLGAGGTAEKPFAAATPVLPVTVNRLDVLVPWFEIQNGLIPGIAETPHVLTRFGSFKVARPETSETRSVCLNCARAIPPLAHSAPKATVVNRTA
jgi:hypothetical protein